VAEHDLLHVVELAGARGCVAEHHLGEWAVRVATARLRDEQQPGDRVIGQTGADPGKVGQRVDAQAGERGFRADSRAEQDRRRADGAGGQSDSPPVNHLWPAVRSDVDTDRPVVGEGDPVGQTGRPDGQVGPVPGR